MTASQKLRALESAWRMQNGESTLDAAMEGKKVLNALPQLRALVEAAEHIEQSDLEIGLALPDALAALDTALGESA